MVSTKIDACLEHYERAIEFVWDLLKSHLNSAIEGSIVISGEKKGYGDVLICLFHLLKLYWKNNRQLFSRIIQIASS